MSDRILIGDALAAFDQSYALAATDEQAAFDRDYWLQRASVAASIAQAEQARVANLIAWKQLRQSQPATALSGAGDAITAEIEAALGIAEPEPDPEPEQTEWFEVVGGVGGRRIAYNLTREDAEKVAAEFARRTARADVPQTPTKVVQQSRRYR